MEAFDLLVIGAGAAGLWAARAAAARASGRAFGAGALPHGRDTLAAPPRIAVIDARHRVGAKILMSGGSRCNLTHVEVRPEDYRGGNRHRVARVLRAHPPSETLRIFTEDLGVAVKTEPTGKVFPQDDRAATVLDALLGALQRAGVPLYPGRRWLALGRADGDAVSGAPSPPESEVWKVRVAGPDGAERETLHARRLLICTGGQSYPKTGSDGSAWEILERLGHTIVPPVPALSPLVLGACFHRELTGVSHPARLVLRVDGREENEAVGPLLWTHFGVSGPVALDLSGPWARARRDRPEARLEVLASFLPEERRESIEARWLETARRHPARTLRGFLDALPQRVADALIRDAGGEPGSPLAQTPRALRSSLLDRLVRFPLPVTGVRGFGQAEVTSGGIPLEETDHGLESLVLPGVHFAGEVLHVDGRLGGFNFQWAWSSATVAAEAAVDRLAAEVRGSGARERGRKAARGGTGAKP